MSMDLIDCLPYSWKGRKACLLQNGIVQLTHLMGGGQIPEFQFCGDAGSNPYWIPQWKLRDPKPTWTAQDTKDYGCKPVGKLLSGIAGHSLCLGDFGMPSEEEVSAGATLHGEAGVRPWTVDLSQDEEKAEARFSVRLPRRGLSFRRTVSLRRGEAVVRFRETVRNSAPTDQYVQWQQHVSLGAPFLNADDCFLCMPGEKALIDAQGYEGCDLLASGVEFEWPHAPGARGDNVDLQVPLQRAGTGFVAGVHVDPHRADGFVCAINHAKNIAFGYVFNRLDFPWVTVWEENLARTDAPWNGIERVRAFEFGVSPLPVGREETIRRGDLFHAPTIARLPAKAEIVVSYAMFLARLPREVKRMSDISLAKDAIELIGDFGKTAAVLPAQGIAKLIKNREASRHRKDR